MRFVGFVAALIAALTSQNLHADECGTAGAPCETGGGTYHIVKPAGAERETPALIFLHGFGGTGKGIISNKGLLAPILARGYAVIAPQGLPWREGSKGGAWNSMARNTRRDDIAFLREVAKDAAARHGIARRNILLAGFSGGGMMAWRTACDAPDSFNAYAPIAGLLWRPLPQKCAGPVKMHHTHGWSDPVVPLEGRSVAGGRFTQGNLFHGLDIIRAANDCIKDDPDTYTDDGRYLTRAWTTCAQTSALSMALHPGGHSIPQGWSAMALDWYETVQ